MPVYPFNSDELDIDAYYCQTDSNSFKDWRAIDQIDVMRLKASECMVHGDFTVTDSKNYHLISQQTDSTASRQQQNVTSIAESVMLSVDHFTRFGLFGFGRKQHKQIKVSCFGNPGANSYSFRVWLCTDSKRAFQVSQIKLF